MVGTARPASVCHCRCDRVAAPSSFDCFSDMQQLLSYVGGKDALALMCFVSCM